VNNSSNILFLCTGNSCRSQIAEGYMRHYLLLKGFTNASANVFSAGLETHGLNPKAVLVMSEVGIDISRQKSNNVTEYLDKSFDFVISVCDHAESYCPNFKTEGIRLHWSFKDPASATGTEEEVLNLFREVRDQISAKIFSWLGD